MTDDQRRLYIDLEAGQTVIIGGASVRMTDKTGRKARLQITASKTIRVERGGKDKT